MVLLLGGVLLLGVVIFSVYGALTQDASRNVEGSAGLAGNATSDGITATLAGGDQSVVVLCHIPSDNPLKAKTISVNRSSVSAHLMHGDYLGPCI